jgi:hypothetical protein
MKVAAEEKHYKGPATGNFSTQLQFLDVQEKFFIFYTDGEKEGIFLTLRNLLRGHMYYL